jgi:hypothetical protein
MNINALLHWPLVMVIHDCYEPDSAAALLRGLEKLDDEAGKVSITLFAEDAAAELGGQVN